MTRSSQGRYGLPGTGFIDSEVADQLTDVSDLYFGVLSFAVTPERKPGVGLPTVANPNACASFFSMPAPGAHRSSIRRMSLNRTVVKDDTPMPRGRAPDRCPRGGETARVDPVHPDAVLLRDSEHAPADAYFGQDSGAVYEIATGEDERQLYLRTVLQGHVPSPQPNQGGTAILATPSRQGANASTLPSAPAAARTAGAEARTRGHAAPRRTAAAAPSTAQGT